jgi:hypothetical protein
MSRNVYRYVFDRNVSVQAAEELLVLAILAAECLHGQSDTRLDASYRFSRDGRACVIDATTDVGRDVARIFTGLAIREFGEDAFKVERLEPAARAKEVQK